MEAVATLRQPFAVGYERTKKEVYNELQSRIDGVILDTMKSYLQEKNIPFNSMYNDLNEFKKREIHKLPKKVQIELANVEKELNKQLGELTEGLRAGSTTAFRKFASVMGMLGKNTAEILARSAAVKVVGVFNPNLGGAALAASIIVPKVVKMGKDLYKTSKENKQAAIDTLLLKLGAVQRDDNNFEFDVPESTRKAVADALKSEGVQISTKDSLQFLKDISELDNQKKLTAVNILNNLKGNPYDIEKEIDQTKLSLKKVRKIVGNDVVAPLSSAALAGLTLANTINTSEWGDFFAPAITALGAGAATGSLAAGLATGVGQYGLTKVTSGLPWIGDAITKISNAEVTLASEGGAVAIALGLRVLPKLVYKGGKGLYDRLKAKKEARERKAALEDQFVDKQIEEKMSIAQEDANQELESRSDNDILVDVVKDFIVQEGIDIPKEVQTKEELKVFISKLPNDQKKKVYKITDALNMVKENNTKSLKTSLMKVGKAAYWGGIIALAGLGAYDTFINQGFIEGVRDRDIFKKDIDEKVTVLTKEEMGLSTDERAMQQAKKALEEQVQQKQSEIDTAVDNIRSNLPETKIEYENLLVEKKSDSTVWEQIGSFFNKTIKNENKQIEIRCNKTIELLGLDTKSGLKKYLEGLDTKDLHQLQEKFGCNSVEELADSVPMKCAIEQVGYGNWYGKYKGVVPQVNEMIRQTNAKEGRLDVLRNIINKQYSSDITQIPLKSASSDEIIKFAEKMESDAGALDSLSVYNAIKGNDMSWGERVSEKMDDLSSESINVADHLGIAPGLVSAIKEYRIAKNMEELEKIKNELQGLSETYTEAAKDLEEVVAKRQGYLDGLASDVPSNAYTIAAEGAAVGVGIGIAKSLRDAKKLKDAQKGTPIARTINFIKSKFSWLNRKKYKELPEGSEIDSNTAKSSAGNIESMSGSTSGESDKEKYLESLRIDSNTNHMEEQVHESSDDNHVQRKEPESPEIY